jgi:ABC-type multidrug transport system ATPase subunit
MATPVNDSEMESSPGSTVYQRSVIEANKVIAQDDKEWALKGKVEAIDERDKASGYSSRALGITWKDLSVQAVSAEAAINETVASQFNILAIVRQSRRKPPLRTILDSSHGCVKPGEMLLVLGRPGSGCTTLLSVLANRRRGYSSIDGSVRYGTMDHSQAKAYRGQIVMNTEEELFFPTLTVAQTMDFATRLKIPFRLPDGVAHAKDLQIETRDFFLEAMGIEHTASTKVGNEYVRGVSGGERKRVSIIECMATRGSVFCWDNSTRGLDAST